MSIDWKHWNNDKKDEILRFIESYTDHYQFLYMIKCWNDDNNNSEIYVGQAKNIFKRYKQHLLGRTSVWHYRYLELIYFEYYRKGAHIDILKRESIIARNFDDDGKLCYIYYKDKPFFKKIDKIIKKYVLGSVGKPLIRNSILRTQYYRWDNPELKKKDFEKIRKSFENLYKIKPLPTSQKKNKKTSKREKAERKGQEKVWKKVRNMDLMKLNVKLKFEE